YDRLLLYDDIDIDTWRVVSTEPFNEGVLLNVEMEGTATVISTGARAPWPKWWSIYAVPVDGQWVADSTMMTERFLAEHNVDGGPPQLARVLAEHPEFDFGTFMYYVAYLLSMPDEEDPCATFLWMLREGEARGDPAVQSLADQMLSILAVRRFDPNEALLTAQESVRYGEASGDPDMIAGAYHQLGNAYALAGRIDEAVANLRKAAMDYDRVFDPREAHESLLDATELEIARSNLRAALADAELYQTMLEKQASPNDRMMAAFRIAEIHQRLGNSDIARRSYEQAQTIARAQKNPEWQLITAQKIAVQENALGNASGARRVLEDARGLYPVVNDPKLIVMSQAVLAAIQLDAGEPDAVERTLDEARAVIAAKAIPAETIASIDVQRSRLRLMQGRPEEALADARTAREKAGSPLAAALTAEGRALRMLSRDSEAEEVLRAAIDVVELELSQLPVDETGSATLLNAQLGAYRELLELLVEQGCARDALTVAERMRARSLRQALEQGHVDLSAGLDAGKREEERKLEQALAEVNRKLIATRNDSERARLQQERDDARLALRSFRSELTASHPRLQAASHAEIPSSIPGGELVLELAVLDRAVFVFALHDDQVDVHRIDVSRQQLERQIDSFVSAIEQRDLGYTEPARALYDLLLAPIAPQLDAATEVRIVPDGVAWRLPFHALVDRRGKHLAERVAIAYAPSVAMMRRASAQSATQRTLLAFGDPAIRTETAQFTRSLFRDVTLGRLPEAASEARTIARLYEGATVRVGADAREAAFKHDAPSYRVLHLAAHSIIDDRAPMFSSIVLSASGKDPLEDGLLEAREIAGLDLRADLAVLSACETARGAVTAGEGVVGLSWAFLAAGVPTTVVSQWKVASASTAELMVEFHRRLRGGRNAPDALRAAMLMLRRDARWRHPFYWAPFAVIENSGNSSERQ
ncbi:MAG TPA: CHAT domain-containing protein, partial [Thermoanaerobaculia bacterium]|nr:CHAT domain-containing protein [Thermoanaerobaculia bacterium]